MAKLRCPVCEQLISHAAQAHLMSYVRASNVTEVLLFCGDCGSPMSVIDAGSGRVGPATRSLRGYARAQRVALLRSGFGRAYANRLSRALGTAGVRSLRILPVTLSEPDGAPWCACCRRACGPASKALGALLPVAVCPRCLRRAIGGAPCVIVH